MTPRGDNQVNQSGWQRQAFPRRSQLPPELRGGSARDRGGYLAKRGLLLRLRLPICRVGAGVSQFLGIKIGLRVWRCQ